MCFQMKRIILLLFWLTSYYCVKGLIEDIPNIRQKTHVLSKSEETEPIVLNCDYDVDSNYQSSLLVKWLKDGKPIYQWIKGHEPSVYASNKGLIDDHYEISSNDNYKYSAIRFLQPTKDISGNYTCMVTTNSTQTVHIYLHVIDVSQLELNMDYDSSRNETLVTCAVENVYPKPTLLITNDDDQIQLTQISEKYDPENNGFFNATSVVSASKFGTDDVITCTVSFFGSDYNITKTLTSSASIIKNTAFVLTTMFAMLLTFKNN